MTLELQPLDAIVRQASASWARFLQLARGDAQAAERLDPFATTRNIAGKSLLFDLYAHNASPAETQLHEGLKQWVYALLQARLSIPIVLEECALRQESTLVPIFGEALSWRSLWRSAIVEPDLRAAEYVKILNERALVLISVQQRASEARVEVARLLGYAHPDEPLLRSSDVDDFDRQFFRETFDYAKDVVMRDRAIAIEGTYARREVAARAREGWPARLTNRFYDEVFSGLGGTVARLPALQHARDVWGAASFARALGSLGLAMRGQYLSLSKLPFAARAHPDNLEGQMLGVAFGLLLASPVFHTRALGLGRDAARDQARLCTTSLLLSLRRNHASSAVSKGVWSVDEAANAVYCGADPTPLMRALLLRRPQFAATSRGISFSVLMVNRFDEDWFRNPRAHQFLIDRAGAPAFATDRANAMTAVECRQWFESRV